MCSSDLPVLLSATALPPRITLMLGGFAVVCATVLVFIHYPLPWDPEDPLELPWIYMTGVWFSIMLAIGYISVYAWQLTEEGRQLAEALAATELVLEREQHLSQLDGLAAAAAHELGTPLATISLVATELARALEPGSPHADDVKLLREQAQRCRAIMAKLTELPTGEPFARVPLSARISRPLASSARPFAPGSRTPGGTASCSPAGRRKGCTSAPARDRKSTRLNSSH